MNMKTLLKTSVAAAALMAVAAPTMAQSNFETGQPKVKLKLYGQVTKQLLWADDGTNSRTFITDSEASSTRIGFTATAPVNADFSFGAQLEQEWKSNAPGNGGVAINNGNFNNIAVNPDNNGVNQTTFTERLAEVTLNHKRFGKISLGQGVVSADGSSEANLSGATLASGTIFASQMGATRLYDSRARAYTSSTYGQVFAVNDPAGRDDRVRYDTPRFMGFAADTSFVSGGKFGVGANYSEKLGQFKIDARVGYHNQNSMNSTIDDEIAGSIAVLHDSGLNAHFVATDRNFKSIKTTGTAVNYKDAENIGGGVGYIAKIFGVGPTAFAVDYYRAEGFERTASTANAYDAASWGIGVQQDFTDIGSSVFLGYRNTSFDAPASANLDLDDVNVVTMGVRVQF